MYVDKVGEGKYISMTLLYLQDFVESTGEI